MNDARPSKFAWVPCVVLLVASLSCGTNASAQETAPPKMNRAVLQVRCEITADGGILRLAARDPADAQTRAAIRNYARALAETLPAGNSESLAVLIPARPELARGLAGSGIACSAEPEGAAGEVGVRFAASNQETRSRVHDFLKAAGDSVERTGGRGADHPGNSLGWDARKDPEISK